MKFLFKKVENPLVKDTFINRFKWWQCRKYGHLTTGRYYGMAQASCRRCGHKTWCAENDYPEWHEPF